MNRAIRRPSGGNQIRTTVALVARALDIVGRNLPPFMRESSPPYRQRRDCDKRDGVSNLPCLLKPSQPRNVLIKCS